ncbi:uncharacterized protein BP5553_03244 [Venustampulla echinocandica]|uniref:Peptidase S8/S53 domain-containing protein n=1 Tax=Venustampulla echinocandica TaxID=2656787 RepID=A0A370TTS0_9HELO|nr:uncharacterized protein BP5553_03244 [Venustampulla echinocandica]RDL38904.1 hypothetical protein BP5553_03244 [Venustampulla echinocandica]
MWEAYLFVLVGALVLPTAGNTSSLITRAPFPFNNSTVHSNSSTYNTTSAFGSGIVSNIPSNTAPLVANDTIIAISTLALSSSTSHPPYANTSFPIMDSTTSPSTMEHPTTSKSVTSPTTTSLIQLSLATGKTDEPLAGTPTTGMSSLATSDQGSTPSTPRSSRSGTPTTSFIDPLPPLSYFTIPPLSFQNTTTRPPWLSQPSLLSNTGTTPPLATTTAATTTTPDNEDGLRISAPDFEELGLWTPTLTSGTVTAAAVTFSFELFSHKHQKTSTHTKDNTAAPTADALTLFKALIPHMTTSADIFGHAEDAISRLNDAVSDGSSTDSGIATAGSSMLNLLGNAFSTGARVGKALADIELEELDSEGNTINQGNLINVVDQIQTELYDLGQMIGKVEPLIKAQLNKKNAKFVLKVFFGVTAARVLKTNLQKLANWSFDSPKAHEIPTPTTKPTATSATSSSSSSSSSATETPKEYCIVTRRGTTIPQYEAFIKSLPDAAEGRRIVYPNLDSQVYTTVLNSSEVKIVRKNPIVFGAAINTSGAEEADDGYGVIPRPKPSAIQERGTETNRVRVPESPDHLRLISQGPKNAHDRESRTIPFEPLPDYVLSPKAGEGMTIYVIDSGIDPGHPEHARSYDPNHFYCVPNSLMKLPERDAKMVPYIAVPDTIMKDTRDHGQCVASLATGIINGVAKKSRLVPVRHRNTKYQITEEAVQKSWRYVINEVVATNNGLNGPPPPPGWAVINYSIGFGRHNGVYGYPSGDWAERKDHMRILLEECWENDIVTVVAAGNEGNSDDYDLSQDIPACLGTTANALITVGASDINGQQWHQTTRDAGLGGSISIWAQGDDIQCAALGDQGFQRNKGTSFAAPQIAGLAAYFMSLSQQELPWTPQKEHQPPYLDAPNLHTKGKVSKAVKDYLVALSYPRIPGGVNVGYNGAEYNTCDVVPGTSVVKRQQGEDSLLNLDEFGFEPILNRRDSSASVCSLSSRSSATSSSSWTTSWATSSTASSSSSSISITTIATATTSLPPWKTSDSLRECLLDPDFSKVNSCLHSLASAYPDSSSTSFPIPSPSPTSPGGPDPRCNGLIKCSHDPDPPSPPPTSASPPTSALPPDIPPSPTPAPPSPTPDPPSPTPAPPTPPDPPAPPAPPAKPSTSPTPEPVCLGFNIFPGCG